MCFLQFFRLVLIFFSFYFVFLFHIYRSLSITLCFSIDSMQLWDYKSVLDSISRFPCLLWFTSFTSFHLHFSTILLLPLCFLSFLFGDSFFFLISTVQVVFYVLFMLSFTCFFNFPVYNHFLHLLEWNCAKLHSKTQWSFMLCVWLFESSFLTVLMSFHRLVCVLECPKMFIFFYAWF